MRSLLAARWRLLRHPVAALLMSVMVASGAAGFASGQVAGHLLHRLAVTHPVAHQISGQVRGSLGQRVGSTVAQQPVVRTVYVPHTSSAHSPRSEDRGHDKNGHKGKHDKHDKDGHGGDHDSGGSSSHDRDRHSDNGDAAPHGSSRNLRPTNLPHQ